MVTVVCERVVTVIESEIQISSGYCAIGGSSEMSQIHVQWSHFSRLLVTVDFDVSFNTKVWSDDHIIIVIYINGVCYRGVFRNVPNSRAVVTLFKPVVGC